MIYPLAAILVCVLMEGLFSGAEIGFYSVNRLRLRSRVEAGWLGARVLQKLLDRPAATMMTTLIATNVMVYLASTLATRLLSTRPHPEFMATLLLTPLIFVLGEVIPKDIFHRKADRLMYRLAGPVDALRVILSPITLVLRWTVSLVTMGRLSSQEGAIFSRASLREWLAEGRIEGVLTDYQHALSANVLDLLKKRVDAAMIPIERAAVLRSDLSGPALREAMRQAGHSRLPVVSGPEKSIVGILHTLDYVCSGEAEPSIGTLLRPAVTVKHDDGITTALVALQRERSQMAVVLGDARTPVGIVTIKDLVEEIVGELHEF